MRNKFRTHPKQLEDEAKVIKKDIKIQKHLNEVQKDLLDPEDIINKLIELEDRSRRMKILVWNSSTLI